MRFVHLLSESHQVVLLEVFAGLLHPLDFLNNVEASVVYFAFQFSPMFFQVGLGNIAKAPDARVVLLETFDTLFALISSRVVL